MEVKPFERTAAWDDEFTSLFLIRSVPWPTRNYQQSCNISELVQALCALKLMEPDQGRDVRPCPMHPDLKDIYSTFESISDPWSATYLHYALKRAVLFAGDMPAEHIKGTWTVLFLDTCNAVASDQMSMGRFRLQEGCREGAAGATRRALQPQSESLCD
jgi:hypothetical protein